MDRRRRAARTVALMSLFTMPDTQTDVPIASFDGDGSDLISLIVGIEPVQAGSGDPSPDNVRPISGWTGAKVTRTGKNLVITQPVLTTNTVQTIVDFGRDVTMSCVLSFDADDITFQSSSAALFDFKKEDGTHQYGTPSNFYRVSDNQQMSTATQPINGKFTHAVSDITFRYLNCYLMSASYGIYTGALKNVQLELDSTASSFEPYSGTTYSITFPSSAGTVYGGTLDVTTGKLTVDRATVDAGNLRWAKDSSGTFYAPWPQKRAGSLKITCSELATLDRSFNFINYADYPDNIIGGNNGDNNQYFYAKATAYATAADFKTAMSGVQLVYELATPIVYDLTPTQVTTLIGTNNIWADTGDIKYIEYNI